MKKQAQPYEAETAIILAEKETERVLSVLETVNEVLFEAETAKHDPAEVDINSETYILVNRSLIMSARRDLLDMVKDVLPSINRELNAAYDFLDEYEEPKAEDMAFIERRLDLYPEG